MISGYGKGDFVGGGWGGGVLPYPGQSGVITKLVDENPFRTITPANPPALTVVELSESNLQAVIAYLLKHGDDPIYLPAGRSALEVGEKRFNIGDFLVLEMDTSDSQKGARVRQPTDTERETYGLGQGSSNA